MATHPSEAELTAYLANQLAPTDEQKVLTHLEGGCPVCDPVITRLEEAESMGRVSIRQIDRVARLALELGTSSFPIILGYEVLEKLGQGGMGTVFRVRTPEGEAALKVIPNAEFANPDAKVRFKREADVLKGLSEAARNCPANDRPHLVELRAAGETDSVCYIEMELALGGTLKDRLNDLAAQPLEAARLVAEVAETIDWMHRQQPPVFHRDLKPSNILLQPRDELAGNPRTVPLDRLTARVSDLGLARCDDDAQLTRKGELIGTPAYLAPELVERSGGATPATEVYALGATLFQILTGRPPFMADTPAQLYAQICFGNPSFPSTYPTVPRDLRTICLKCLEWKPVRRYQTAGELAADLRRFLASKPIVAQPPGVPLKAVRLCRKHPVVVIVCIAFLLFAITGWALYERSSSRAHLAEERLKALEKDSAATLREFELRMENERSRTREADNRRWMLHNEGLVQYQRAATLMAKHPQPAKPDVKALQEKLTAHAVACLEAAHHEAPDEPAHRYFLGHVIMQRAFHKMVSGTTADTENALADFTRAETLLMPYEDDQSRNNLSFLSDRPIAEVSLDPWVKRIRFGRVGMLIQLRRATEALIEVDQIRPDLVAAAKAEDLGRIPTILDPAEVLRSIGFGMSAARGSAYIDEQWPTARLACLCAAEVEQSKLPWSRGPSADHSKAMRLSAYLAEAKGVSGPAVYNVACTFSLAATEPGLDPGEQDRRAVQAVAYLRRIHDAGYFNHPLAGARRRKDLWADVEADFKPLRDRPDFQAICQSIKSKGL